MGIIVIVFLGVYHFYSMYHITNIIFILYCFRYIPVGVLEHLPQKINERPPHYKGRDDLETLMASSNCADWIKIRYVKELTPSDHGGLNPG